MKTRYWRIHFYNDPPEHWISIDCGKPVDESEAVRLAEAAFPMSRGSVTNAIQDYETR